MHTGARLTASEQQVVNSRISGASLGERDTRVKSVPLDLESIKTCCPALRYIG